MSEQRDLSEGFPEYHRPPPDVVPHTPDPDAPPIPTGPQTVIDTEVDENGVTRTETREWVGPTFDRKGNHYDNN